MSSQPPHLCDGMADALGDELRVVRYTPKFRQYGLIILDRGTGKLAISFCPFCGATLPGSLRRRWFEVFEESGLEPGDDRIPASMLTNEWWLGTE